MDGIEIIGLRKSYQLEGGALPVLAGLDLTLEAGAITDRTSVVEGKRGV